MPEEDNTVGTKTTFQELPDAPPRRKIRFTVTGKIGNILCRVLGPDGFYRPLPIALQ